jgi:hypothetical protein
MILLIKLILAHLLGDFVFQTASWVKAKEEKRLSAWQLYAHSLIHGLLIFVLVWDFGAWKIALLITVAHFTIDTVKIYAQRANTRRMWFFIDQAAHFVSITAIAFFFSETKTEQFYEDLYVYLHSYLLLITSIIFLTQPVSIAIKVFISKWTPQIGEGKDAELRNAEDIESLASAGKYIGILERLFVFTFVVSGQWQAIGFLIAAKSIFRFGYLKESKNRKLTEYILIGTLVSFGIAMLTGLIYLKFARGLN